MVSEKDSVQVATNLANSHENVLPKKQLIIVFSAMALALFLCFVDQTGVTVALPYIAEELDAADTISWAGTSTLISTTMFMVLFGRFSDILSRKYVLVGSMIILAIFDLACGFAQTATQIYVFRGFTGIGTGGITSLSMIIVSDIVSLKDRGKYQGILGACVGLGNAMGPFLCSAFISRLSWRRFYYFLCPVIISATGVIIWLVPYTKLDMPMKQKLLRIDYFGFLFSSIAIIFLLVPASGGGSLFEWNSPLVISFFVIGAIAAAIFVIIEAKVAILPMIPLKLFSTRLSLTSLLSQNLFFGMCYYGHIYYYPYYFQVVRRESSTMTSVFLLALVIPQSLTSVICGQIISRTGHYIFVIWYGYCTWLIAMGLLFLWRVDSGRGLIVITLIVNGTGVGAIFQPTLVAAQAQSFKRDRAAVISTRNLLRSLGGAVGLAISAAIVSNSYKNIMLQSLLFSTREISELTKGAFSTPDFLLYSSSQQVFLEKAYMSALRRVFYFWVGCMGLCVASTAVVRDKGLEPIDDKPTVVEKEN